MVSAHLEKIIFHNILTHDQYMDVSKETFFDEPVLKTIFPAVKEFWDKYRETPTLAQAIEIIKIKGIDKDVTTSQLQTLWDCDLSTYENTWLEENTQTFIEYKNLDTSVTDLVRYLRTTPVNIENIKEIVDNAKRMVVDRNNIDFNFNEGSDFFNPASHRQQKHLTFSSGYPYIDLVGDGGFSAKTLTVLLGQAKVGKSIWLANIAAKAVQMGHNTAVITLEMSESLYIKRLGANLLGIPISEYKNKAEDQVLIKKKLGDLGFATLSVPGQLLVKEFPTSTASVLDIEAYLRRVEEKRKIKFKVVVIDYINILKNWRNPNTENTYMKIKQIAEDARAMAQRNEWAIISATQIKQSSFDMSDLNMGSASESSGLVATVDMMFGIIQDPIMYKDKRYLLKNLANRNEGYKNSKKEFDIDYNYMRITESSAPMTEGDVFG